MDQLQKLEQDFREIERKVNSQFGDGQTTALGAGKVNLLDPQPIAPIAPKPTQDQQIVDGDFSFSINGFYETVAAPGTDRVKECAHWFSNDSIAPAVALGFTDARTSSVNQTLKTTSHSNYNAAYCDWDDSQGVARMTGTKSLDAPFPTSPLFPGRTEYSGAIIARRSEQIVIPTDCHLGAFLYNNTGGSEDVIEASAADVPSGTVRGTPAVTTERRYKVFTRTDKGFTVLSGERTIAAAPSDADFATCDVYLTWKAISGAIEYHIYRHDITAAKYRRLIVISSGATTYADNNHVDAGFEDVGGYPATDFDRVRCHAATSDGDLSNLPVNGVALKWADVFWNIPVPDNVTAIGTGNQVLRLQLDKEMDRQLTDAASTAASKRIQSATGAFTVLDTGRSATLYAADGVTVLHGPEAITFVDATHVDFATNVATTNAAVILYIVGGGDHGLLIDMIHIGWVQGAKYSSYPDDLNRTLAPAASPNGSSQGGVGDGGSGSGDAGDGGIGGCITMDCPTWIFEGNRALAIPFKHLRRGFAMVSGNLTPNYSQDILLSETNDLHIVTFENGIWVPCSPGQRFFTSVMDPRGTSARRLNEGDFALTMLDGRVERSRIVNVRATGQSAKVGTPALEPNHAYVAGYRHLPWRQRLFRWLWPKDRGASGAVISNRKINEFGEVA